MFCSGVRRLAVAGCALLLAPLSAGAWPLGGPLYTRGAPCDPFPPSQYGYNLDDPHPGYYGGGRYLEYYKFDRGFGWANYPGPLPNPIYSHPYHGMYADHTLAPVLPPHLAPAPAPVPCAHIEVQVPPGAEVWIEGMKSVQTGPTRNFDSPPLTPGEKYTYEVRARWNDGERPAEQRREVNVRAGERVVVSFPEGQGAQGAD